VVTIAPHPLLDAAVFTSVFPKPLGELGTTASSAFFSTTAQAPLQSSDEVRGAIRDLLRHGGYKPTGRGKPASEYLIRAVSEGALASINAAVDACNAVSLHSGLPISVVDLDRSKPPFRIGLAPAGTEYLFNASGQSIDVEGLLCLFDADGACANAVKDSQRTKTTPATTRTLSVVWGSKKLSNRTAAALDWYKQLLGAVGASVEVLETTA
jgi:DNA/RNA-binding domain of Phe-tRNA-synthetase-like protein